MTSTEQAIIREISTLPASRQALVLSYIRLLKLGLDTDEKTIVERFDKSWKHVSARAQKLKITQADIDTEIRAVRNGE